MRQVKNKMSVGLDKTRPIIGWLRCDIPSALANIVSSVTLALEKTPIYFEGNKRSKSIDLVSSAEHRIPNYIKKHGIQFDVLSEQEIKKHFNKVSTKDRLDLFIKLIIDNKRWFIVVEFDSARADQVAKKFVSRIAQIPNESMIYIAFCYPGTNKMNLSEVNKYFTYMETISKNMQLAGFIGMTPPKNLGDL